MTDKTWLIAQIVSCRTAFDERLRTIPAENSRAAYRGGGYDRQRGGLSHCLA